MKKSSKKKSEIKSPWTKFYGDKQTHLNYFDGTIYEYLESCSRSHMDFIAYEYYGKTVTYRKFLQEIDEAAKALKAQGVKLNIKNSGNFSLKSFFKSTAP